MKKLIVSLLTLLILLSSCLVVGAAGFRDEYGFTYEADSHGNLSVTGFDGTEMDVMPAYSAYPVVKIKNLAFMNNTTLESLSFENAINLTTIGVYSFAGCTSLGAVSIPWGISDVSIAAFKGCTSMTDVQYYSKSNAVSNECFSGCTSLTDVTLGDEITSIGNYSFGYCSSLEYIALPKSITSISPTAFYETPVTFGVYYDSYAYHYAIENNIEYRLLDGVKLGDVNGDGIVNVDDATLIQKYLAELETIDGIYLQAADSNEDTEIDVSDATAIQMYAAEYQTGHPIGQVMTK